MKNANFEDPAIRIKDVSAHLNLANKSKRIETLGDLFKVDNVVDLDFDQGALVVAPTGNQLTLEAAAEFEVTDITRMSNYLPKLKSLDLFRQWAEAAFQDGVATNGRLHYDGELSLAAINEGRASLQATADFEKAHVDYSPKLGWPAVTNASGLSLIHI